MCVCVCVARQVVEVEPSSTKVLSSGPLGHAVVAGLDACTNDKACKYSQQSRGRFACSKQTSGLEGIKTEKQDRSVGISPESSPV